MTTPSLHDAPIRVAHLLDGRLFGGAEQMVLRLIEASPRVNVEAWLYCLSEGRLSRIAREKGFNVRVAHGAGRFDPRVLPRLIRVVRDDDIQVLQAHTSRTHLIARLISRRLGRPNLTTIHSPIALDENRSTRRHPLRAWIERLGRPWTDRILPVSEEETRRLIEHEHVPREKLTWIPNGQDPAADFDKTERRAQLNDWLARQGHPPDSFVVAMIAQMRPRKGPEHLIRAFARLRRERGVGVLLMIGNDEFTGTHRYLDELKALAQTEGLGDAVCFTGFMDDPWSLAAGADVFALPSLFGEGMPLVLLEAMNHARSIAVADVAGCRELVVHGESGWLHTPGDEATLAGHLARAADDPDRARRMGEAGRRRFLERYTLDQSIEAHRDVYEQVLRERGERS